MVVFWEPGEFGRADQFGIRRQVTCNGIPLLLPRLLPPRDDSCRVGAARIASNDINQIQVEE